jgi:outer membrane protein OmpA-like peptidoglycan-associated protein
MRRVACLLAFGQLLFGADARAQNPTIDGFTLVPMHSGNMLSLWGSETFTPGSHALQLGLEARQALATSVAAQSRSPLATLELLATFALVEGFDVSTGLAIHRGDFGARVNRTVIGDVWLVPRLRVWRNASGGGLATLVAAALPAGNDETLKREGLRFEPRLLASQVSLPFVFTANAGYLLHTRSDFDGAASNAVLAGAGVELGLGSGWSGVSELTSRLYANAPGADLAARLPAEARLAVRFTIAGWVTEFGGGLGLWGGPSEPDWRLIAALSFDLVVQSQPQVLPPLPDRDQDGIPDASDACGDEPGTRTLHGCPARAPPNEVAPALEEPLPDVPLGVEQPETFPVLLFQPNQWHLGATQLALLDETAARMRAAPPDVYFVVEGHSDVSGPPPFNSIVARKRAMTMRHELIRRGVPWHRITVAVYGSSRPPDGSDPVGARRVEFRMIKQSGPR